MGKFDLDHWIDDGYPRDRLLKTIRKWDCDIGECFDLIRRCWWHGDTLWREKQRADVRVIFASTGGWSGNESIIGAMKHNAFLWLVTWRWSRRGGHYSFSIVQEARRG